MASKETKVKFYAKELVCKRCNEHPARYGRMGMCERCYNIDRDERKRQLGQICQVPGCNRGIRMRGFCMSHYIKFIRNVEHGRWTPYRSLQLPQGCSACGWNKAACDYHHIIERCNGGTCDAENILYLCPNCHRLAHLGRLDVSSLPTLADVNRNC